MDTPYCNAKVIMEQAVQDKYFQAEKTKHHLEIVNNCRMFLGVIYLSKIADHHGRISLQILNGDVEISMNTKYNYPEIRKPPAAKWSIWKAFLCRNFLIKDYQIYPSLTRRNMHTRSLFKVTPNTIHSMVTKPTLKEIINTMPKEYLDILGEITIPEDNGVHIWEGILDSKVIGASDGSLINESNRPKGGFSYSLQQYNDNQHRIIGYGATPLSTKTSSMTSEKYGVIATLIIIKCIF